ncbi:MAG: hypothetical protein ACTHNU_02790 [Gaiellales bacterium]
MNGFGWDANGNFTGLPYLGHIVSAGVNAGTAGDLVEYSLQQDLSSVQTVTNVTVGLVFHSSPDGCDFQIQTVTMHQ